MIQVLHDLVRSSHKEFANKNTKDRIGIHYPLDAGYKVNVHKTSRRRPRRLGSVPYGKR